MTTRKTFAFMISFLITSSVMANCPNLAGEWTCTDDQGELRQQKVDFGTDNGVPSYTITDNDGVEVIYADGVTRQKVEDGDVVNYSFSCENNSLVGNFAGEGYTAKATMNLLNTNNMTSTISITMTEFGLEHTSVENCSK